MTRRLYVAESAAAYLRRSRIVVDSSVLAAALFAEPELDRATSWMTGHALCAPHLIDYEIANVALGKMRRKLLDKTALGRAMENFSKMDIERHATNTIDLVALAEHCALTAYDASYLWLASTLQAPLLTFDARLGAAAQKHLREDRG